MRVKAVLLATCIGLGMAGCNGGGSPNGEAAAGEVATGGVRLPRQILGLQVAPEDVAKEFESTKRSYVASVGLFSMRENDLVRATLQVSRFNRLANPDSPSFRSLIINRLGTAKAETLQVGDTDVYVTSGTDQQIFAWFEGRGFYILTTHRDYEFPRALARRVIETKQKLG